MVTSIMLKEAEPLKMLKDTNLNVCLCTKQSYKFLQKPVHGIGYSELNINPTKYGQTK